MRNNLDSLLSDGIIDEVLGRLKSGKEADVFLVRYRGEVVAAKVYKDRHQRSFKNNAAYKEGRKVRNSRTQRAMDKGSRFGRDEAEDAWKSSEANALQLLHARGVRVPTPVLFYDGVLLMQLVTDAEGDAAPRLIDAPIGPDDAGALYRDLRGQVIGMLCCDLIHGDLSPYNVLLGVAGPTIIDFPQTISAAHNTQSEAFFRRDLDNILRFLAGIDRRLFAHGNDAREIWRAYVRRDLTPDFAPPTMAREDRRPPPPQRPQDPRPQHPRAPRPQYSPESRPQRPPEPRPQHARPQDPRPQRPPEPRPQHARPQDPQPPRPRESRPPPRYQEPRSPRPPEPRPQRPHEPAAAPPQQPRGPHAHAQGRPGPRHQQAARSHVEVYVKRTGARPSSPPIDAAPPPPPAPDAPEPRRGGGPQRRRRG